MKSIKLYEFESSPLSIVTRPVIGKVYYTSFGDAFKAVGESKDSVLFDKVHESVLNPGLFVEDLTEELLNKLFWPLSRTELKKVGYAVNNTSKRS